MTTPNWKRSYEFHLRKSELDIRRKELEVKKSEVTNAAQEMRNRFLRDVRARIDTLLWSILLISGGALTVSVGNFLRFDHLPLSPVRMTDLKWAWGLLFGSMVLCVLTLTAVIITSEVHGKNWNDALKTGVGEVKRPKHLYEFVWIAGILAVVSCSFGLGFLAIVAIGTFQ